MSIECDLLQFSPTDWSRELQGICTAFVRDSYETLKDVQDTAVLQHCFGTELLQQLEQQSLERQQLLRSLKIRGHVLEQPPLNVPQDPSGPAVSGEQGLKQTNRHICPAVHSKHQGVCNLL